MTRTVYARYNAYLLRLSQETPGGPWRILLQPAGAADSHGFADLESLFAFLQKQMALSEPESETGSAAQPQSIRRDK